MIDFNQPLSREGTHAEKYERRLALFGTEDVLPMWVADMDLATPNFILDALKQRLEHPILGYTSMPDSAYQAIINWQAQHGYRVKLSEIVFTHNVANGFFMAVSAFTQPGESILVQPPIYPPFLSAPIQNQRQLVEVPLVLKNNRYEIDFTAFEQTIIDHNVQLLLFCNPQNPSGRVWLKSELEQLAAICLKLDVLIISDEIHSDLVFPGHTHVPIASLSPEIAKITITLSSPGKTFNLGGLQIGYAIIANPKLKAAYLTITKSVAIYDLNLFAVIALQAAYSEQGMAYKTRLMAHLAQNIALVDRFFKQHYPVVKVMKPDASFLIWLDFNPLFEDQTALKNWLIQQAKLGLNDGLSFGQAGKGFMRMNIAVSQPVLQQAFARLLTAKPLS